MKTRRRSKRGFTLVEAIIASLILTVAIVAMFQSWSTCFAQNKKLIEFTQAEEIDKSVLEIAKVFGPMNLPTGTYSSSTQLGTWTGAYIPATGWTASATAYYDFTGTQLAASNSTGVYFKATVIITDAGVQVGTGTTYSIENSTLRSIVVTTSRVRDSSVVLAMATNIIVGGA